MATTAAALKQQLGRVLKDYWATASPNYFGFLDPAYEPLTKAVFKDLLQSTEPVAYVPNVYDCEDHGMEFRVHVAKRQVARYPGVKSPFAVGFAMGHFSWVSQGKELHVANFAVMDDDEVRWIDLRAQKWFPFEDIRPGLRGVII